MWKQYIKQAWQLIKANPVISVLSIAGTALSIATIMVNVLAYEVEVASYAPETKRNRMLYADVVEARHLEQGWQNRTNFSPELVKECFYALRTPEAVSAQMEDVKVITLPGQKLFKEYNIKATDHFFWNMFDFTFLAGVPFDEADFNSGITKVVISENTARELFNSADVLGETISIDFIYYIICGVVKDVSNAADKAYGEAWIPYSTIAAGYSGNQGIGGNLITCILAANRKDFDDIKQELKYTASVYSSTKEGVEINFMNFPITHLEKIMGIDAFNRVSRRDFILQQLGILLLILLVPALNLSGIAQSSMQQRKEEMGIRKTFGANSPNIVWQVIGESFVITLIGGLIGFALSFLFLYWFNDFLFSEYVVFTPDMFIQPTLFILAFLFILLLNLLSIGIPAWRISRQPILTALNSNN